MFLDLPLDELFEHSVPLRLLVKDRVNQLEDELSESRTDEKRRKQSINQINLSRGKIDIETLASETFLSRNQFERIFRSITYDQRLQKTMG